MKFIAILLLFPFFATSQQFSASEITRYQSQAQRVNIIRDNWGVPHIYGKTDADVVFGLLYTQCEESFSKVEMNNLEMLGRLSEVSGESQVYDDLQMRMIYDSAAAVKDYNESPAWMHKLLDASADGVNYYLYMHPEVKPQVLTRFEPWFALLRTNGSISATQLGGATLTDLRNLYPVKNGPTTFNDKPLYNIDPTGSNGFAVSPSKTSSKNAILYINPHVNFYYRSEVQMVSEEGLNAYGAVTWGTFFIFQGFNEYCGWMHTSGSSDVADLYKETVEKKVDKFFTKYDNELKPVRTRSINIKYKKGDGFGTQQFNTYYSVHGPVVGSRNGAWLSARENNRSLNALMQSWLRTKTRGFDEFKKVMEMRSNTSDNTVFADNKGNIAYWHGNFLPVRSKDFDYSLPVDGSVSASDWKGIHALDQIVHVYNPASGFIQNCNSTPFTVSGVSSPKAENYPLYMAPDGENFRGVNASAILSKAKNLDVDKMISEVGYNMHLAFFDEMLPVLIRDFETVPKPDSLAEAIKILKEWDRNSSANSVATAVAMEYAYRFITKYSRPSGPYQSSHIVELLAAALKTTTSTERLAILSETLSDLGKRFGSWKTTWGDINRYQRPADGRFSDKEPSLPVGLGASAFGALPSFASRRLTDTNKRYGSYGNSFVASVEFGKKVKAKSVITGGQSFDPKSKHFDDQAEMYINGKFKEVLFYKDEVLKHIEKQYHPGQ